MASHKSPEEKNVVKLIESAPFSEEDKKTWTDQIQADGLSAELMDAIHTKLKEIPIEKFAGDWQHAKFSMDFAAILKRWQMGEASKQFRHNR